MSGMATILYWQGEQGEDRVHRHMTRPLGPGEAAETFGALARAGLAPRLWDLDSLAHHGLPHTYLAPAPDVAWDKGALTSDGRVQGGVRLDLHGHRIARLWRDQDSALGLWRCQFADGTHALLGGTDLVRVTRDWRGVVHVSYAPFDVYIGRAVGRMRLPQSPWANPYRVGPDLTAEEAVARYRDHVLGRPDLLARLGELRGKRLGCWCKVPGGERACHGDVLVELSESLGGEG